MHQQFRHPPRGSSPATSPQTNPTRTNNPRDALASNRARAPSETAPPGPSIEVASEAVSAAQAVALSPTGRPTRDSFRKLDQIIQNLHLKAAVLVVQSRIPVTPSGGPRGRRTNRWFQIETDEIDDFRDELRTWRHCSCIDNWPPPLVIETYLDASRLATGQALVVIDENGKRWDALEALNASELSTSESASTSSGGRSDSNNSNKIRTRSTEIILERWKVELQSIPSLSKSSSATGTSTGSPGGGGTPGGGAGGTGGGDRGRPVDVLADLDMEDFGPILPAIYKRSIVFFRSLYVTTCVMPCYRFSRPGMTKNVHPALRVRCRVLTGPEADARVSASGFDSLRQPLFFNGDRDVVTDYMFGDLELPIGRFSASVTYRNECSFRVDDSESLLSSRFMGIDENYFRPSLPTSQRADTTYIPPQHQRRPSQPYQPSRQPYQQDADRPYNQNRRDTSADVVGSLPSRNRQGRSTAANSYQPQPQQTYGSLSTFHGAGALGTSPISALKAVRPIGSDTSSPTDSTIRPPSSTDQRPHVEPPNSLPITAEARYDPMVSAEAAAAVGGAAEPHIPSRPPSLRNLEGLSRRTSVSFQPFKAGSLSGSPRIAPEDFALPSSPLSGSRPSSGLSALAQARNRSSLTAGMAASLRGAPLVSTSVGSTSAAATVAAAAAAAAALIEPGQSPSPRPGGSRYSSSFTHRRGRSSFGGTSRGDDDQGSSGKQSLASSMAQPGSGLLAEVGGGGGGGTSSGSFQTDDDNISEFLKTLESKKTLQSFEASSRRGEPARRTAAQLSRFQLMRESNVALTDSMNSSMQLPARSSGASSRQLPGVSGVSGVSGMSGVSGASAASGGVAAHAAASMSVSMSPIKPLSPHTPHTPAIPSRLSENSIIDYQGQTRTRVRPGSSRAITSTAEEGEEGESAHTGSTQRGGTTAIDIPLSPRLPHTGRRSSSVAQKTRALIVDDDADLAAFGGQRSLSLGADDREPPSPGTLFRLEGPDVAHGAGTAGTDCGPAATASDKVAGPSTAPAGSSAAAAAAAAAAGGLQPAAILNILRPSGAGGLSRSLAGRGGDDSSSSSARGVGAASMPPAPGAVAAAALRLQSGTSSRLRYTSRLQQQQQPGTQPSDSTAGPSRGSDGRPTPLHSSRASLSSSFMGRYGGGGGSGRGSGMSSGLVSAMGSGVATGGSGDGDTDGEPLVFDLLELGRSPNRRSLEEARTGPAGSNHSHLHHVVGNGSNPGPAPGAADRNDGYDHRRRPW